MSLPSRRSAPDCPRIVIVDDDAAVRASLQLRFELEGFHVCAFATAEAASAASPDADCFVLDLRLPGMSGLEYLAAIRERGETAPAILITGQPVHWTRAQAAGAGVSLVEKPLLSDSLIDAVKRALTGA
jgi:two-component system, LuxR family, response regulator FixJ